MTNIKYFIITAKQLYQEKAIQILTILFRYYKYKEPLYTVEQSNLYNAETFVLVINKNLSCFAISYIHIKNNL